jgi:hypothetical protein
VARLSYENRDESLFSRGQNRDYQSKAGGTTLYPSIYREDSLSNRDLRKRFDLLERTGRLLAQRFHDAKIEGHKDVRLKKYIQWSILQHYEVLSTPLLDLTHSLRVACSFAQLGRTDSSCYVYVLGLPYLTNRISINSEHDLVNIRLLSICPPAALRPYFQEGYLAGTADVTADFDTKTELDFRNRLIAKFEIPGTKSFWGTGFDQIPESSLYPRGDKIREVCEGLVDAAQQEQTPGELGEFMIEWAKLASDLLRETRLQTQRNLSVREAIRVLMDRGIIPGTIAKQLDRFHVIRNLVVHQPDRVKLGDMLAALEEMKTIRASKTWIKGTP